MDPLIKSQLLYQLSYAPVARLGATGDTCLLRPRPSMPHRPGQRTWRGRRSRRPASRDGDPDPAPDPAVASFRIEAACGPQTREGQLGVDGSVER